MTTRRNFLGTLGKLLGASGVLLPLAGKGALALPADLGTAASLPVVPTALPVSSEMFRLRETREALHQIYLWGPQDYRSSKAREDAWRNVMRDQHEPIAAAIVGRKKPTWADCAEIAEVALHQMSRRGPRDRSDPLNALVFAVLSASGQREFMIPEIGDFSLGSEPAWLRSEEGARSA